MRMLCTLLILALFGWPAAAAITDPAAETLKEAAAIHREVRDLQAQEDMAFWAKWMLYATCGSIVISAFALVGLFSSLIQTRRAIQDNREIGEAQTIAYMTAENLQFRLVSGSSPPFTPIIDSHWRNSGSTPAFDFQVNYNIVMVKRKTGEIFPDLNLPANVEQGARSVSAGSEISAHANNSQKSSLQEHIALLTTGGLDISITVVGRYRTVFGQWMTVKKEFVSQQTYDSGVDYLGNREIEVKMAKQLSSLMRGPHEYVGPPLGAT